MSTSSPRRLEEGRSLLGRDNPPPPSTLGTRLGWGTIALVAFGLGGLGGFALSRSPSDAYDKAAEAGLIFTASMAFFYSVKRIIWPDTDRVIAVVSSPLDDVSARTQAAVLSQIDNRLTTVLVRFGQNVDIVNGHKDVVTLIEEKITLLDGMLGSTVADRDHYNSQLTALTDEFAPVKAYLARLKAQHTPVVQSPMGGLNPATALSPAAANSPAPSTPSRSFGSPSALDLDELSKMLGAVESFESKVRVSLGNAPSGRSTPGARTPVALTPQKDAPASRSAGRVSPANLTSAINGDSERK